MLKRNASRRTAEQRGSGSRQLAAESSSEGEGGDVETRGGSADRVGAGAGVEKSIVWARWSVCEKA